MPISPYPRIVLTAEREQCKRDLSRAVRLLAGSTLSATRAVQAADRDLYERRLDDLDEAIAALQKLEKPSEEQVPRAKE